jgi:hypothetical protein
MNRTAVNLVAFQVGWFSCVLGAAFGYPYVGAIVVAIVISLHLYLAHQSSQEMLVIGVAALAGIVFDSALVQSGWVEYQNGMLIAGSAPYWIVAMWMSFATTLNMSLRWLHGRIIAAVLFGAVGGPLSYLAGARLGALEIIEYGPAIVALCLGWALATPLLVAVAKRFDGMRQCAPATVVHQHA